MTRAAPPGQVTFNGDNPTWNAGYADASVPLARRTGYRLATRNVGDTSNYQQVVRMSLLTDSTTDLVKWSSGFALQSLARVGGLEDLTGAWDEAEAKGWVAKGLRAFFTWDGKPYGIPMYKSYYAVFYSKAAFARLGVGVPTTWQEFLDVASRARAASITPIVSPGASSWEALIWYEQLLVGTDPRYYAGLSTGEVDYTAAPARRAMDLWSQMYADGLFSAPDVDVNGVPEQMRTGKSAMMLHGTWKTQAMLSAGLTSKDFGLFLLPPVEPGAGAAVVIESGAMAVPVKAHKRAAAMDVSSSWLADDVQRSWVAFLGDFSANPGVVPAVPAIEDLAEQVTAVRPVEYVRYSEAVPDNLWQGNVRDLGAFTVDPTPGTAEQVLARMQDRSDREWQAWRA